MCIVVARTVVQPAVGLENALFTTLTDSSLNHNEWEVACRHMTKANY